MAGEIIRKGDRTSHGGTVLEGSPADICMGQPIAYIGHQTYCPKCKGNFPIVEGVITTTFYGKCVAVAGMKTACGATLIAGQFTDIVEWQNTLKAGAGSSSQKEAPSLLPGNQKVQDLLDDAQSIDDEPVEIEHYYMLTDANGDPLEHYRYDLYVNEDVQTRGASYMNGRSVVVAGDPETRLVTWIDRDSVKRA